MEPPCWLAIPAVTHASRISSSRCITCRSWNSGLVTRDYARPMRQWRKDWPESYHQMLRVLREKWPEGGRGVQEFVRVLRLHEEHPPALGHGAIEQALADAR